MCLADTNESTIPILSLKHIVKSRYGFIIRAVWLASPVPWTAYRVTPRSNGGRFDSAQRAR